MDSASAGIRSLLAKSRVSTVLIGAAVVRSNPQPTSARAGIAARPASRVRRLIRPDIKVPSVVMIKDVHHGRNHAARYLLATGDS
jgi:hypothetical protein